MDHDKVERAAPVVVLLHRLPRSHRVDRSIHNIRPHLTTRHLEHNQGGVPERVVVEGETLPPAERKKESEVYAAVVKVSDTGQVCAVLGCEYCSFISVHIFAISAILNLIYIQVQGPVCSTIKFSVGLALLRTGA